MIQHLLINAAFILGLSIITREDYVLYPYRWLCMKIPFFHKPLISCVVCMSSIYGLLYYLLVIDYNFYTWQQIPFYLIALAFTVAVGNALLQLLLSIRDYWKIQLDSENRKLQELIQSLKTNQEENANN